MRARGLLAAALLALAACATPAPTRYYTLTGKLPPPGPATSAYRVAIGPVSVPESLDRGQIVLRVAPDRYAISDGARWSAPLKREIPRAIAAELGRRLPAARAAAYAQYGAQDADYRVLIDVVRFESVPGVGVTLDAAWALRGRAGARLYETRAAYQEAADGPGVEPLVRAHRRALAALAGDIAAALAARAGAAR